MRLTWKDIDFSPINLWSFNRPDKTQYGNVPRSQVNRVKQSESTDRLKAMRELIKKR